MGACLFEVIEPAMWVWESMEGITKEEEEEEEELNQFSLKSQKNMYSHSARGRKLPGRPFFFYNKTLYALLDESKDFIVCSVVKVMIKTGLYGYVPACIHFQLKI